MTASWVVSVNPCLLMLIPVFPFQWVRAGPSDLLLTYRIQPKWWDATSEIRLQKEDSFYLGHSLLLSCSLWGKLREINLCAMKFPMKQPYGKELRVTLTLPINSKKWRPSVQQTGRNRIFPTVMWFSLEVEPYSVKPSGETAVPADTFMVTLQETMDLRMHLNHKDPNRETVN